MRQGIQRDNLKLIICLSELFKKQKAGSYNMMIANNPIYIIYGEKNDK